MKSIKESLGFHSIRKTEMGAVARKPRSRELSLGVMEDGTKVSLAGPSLQSHAHVIGATRYGKSKLVEGLLRQKLSDRQSGFILLDPHGKLYEDLVHYLSHKKPYLAKRVVLFDPANMNEWTVGFNPIPKGARYHPEYVVDNLVSSCLKAWQQDSSDATPRIKRWLENIFYTLLSNNLTLLEAAALIDPNQAKFRKDLTPWTDPMVAADWAMFEKLHPITKKWEMLEGPSNRLRKFLINPIIRTIIGGQKRNLDVLSIMDEGKILLINLDGRDRISHENMRFLGNLLVNEIFRCAMLRNHRDPRLKPCDVVIDEFPDYVNRQAARILDQAGKKQVWLWLLHQHLDQLEQSDSEDSRMIAASIKTNCQTKIVFGGLSRSDAETMSLEMMTGYFGVEEKVIKEELYTTKERHVPDVWEVLTETCSTSTGSSESRTEGTSETFSESRGFSHGSHSSYSESSGTGESWGENRSYSESDSYRNDGRHGSQSEGRSRGSSSGRSESAMSGYSDGTSYSQTESETSARGRSESMAEGSFGSESKGHSVTYQKHYRPEEYQELSKRTYWQVDELKEIAVGQMKNLPKRWCWIKQGSNRPFKVRVHFVRPVYYSRVTSEKRIARFVKRARKEGPAFYRKTRKIKQEIRDRHLEHFGHCLFDSPIVSGEDVQRHAQKHSREISAKPASKVSPQSKERNKDDQQKKPHQHRPSSSSLLPSSPRDDDNPFLR